MNKVGTILEETRSYNIVNVSTVKPKTIKRGIADIEEAQKIAGDYLELNDSIIEIITVLKQKRVSRVCRRV